MANRVDIAEKMFPDVTETIDDLLAKYPKREWNPVVSRMWPSPTWFMHIGNFYQAFTSRKYAKQNNGVFFIRIEDTDQKREVEWAVEIILEVLKSFGVVLDEWPIGENMQDVWNYGPYTQSKRKHIYRVFAKHLVQNWLAYPCWMSEEEVNSIRDGQAKAKLVTGIYWNYSFWRNKTPDELMEKLETEWWFFPVLRLRSHWDLNKKVDFEDVIKWKINMADNYNEAILLKKDWLPTYHFAHIVDDTLMRTTHVIRWEERLTSVPLHIQIFQAFNFPVPFYAHIAPLLKLDNWNKRKLSKRYDPEANMKYFFEQWFPVQWLMEYLLTIMDSSFETWRSENPNEDFTKFVFSLERMNTSGALFDLTKLQNICNNYLSRISTDELFDQWLARAKTYKPDLAELMLSDIDYTKQALNIERKSEKDPKRFTLYSDIENQIRFFYDKEREILRKEVKPLVFAESEDVTDKLKSFVDEYMQILDLNMSVEDWFAQLKEIWKKYWFAWNNAEFKEWWYIWKIWDLAMFLRINLCCSAQTPDLFSVMKVMGKERMKNRLK